MIIATIRPAAVVNRACEIPPATTAGDMSFAAFIASNANHTYNCPSKTQHRSNCNDSV